MVESPKKTTLSVSFIYQLKTRRVTGSRHRVRHVGPGLSHSHLSDAALGCDGVCGEDGHVRGDQAGGGRVSEGGGDPEDAAAVD